MILWLQNAFSPQRLNMMPVSTSFAVKFLTAEFSCSRCLHPNANQSSKLNLQWRQLYKESWCGVPNPCICMHQTAGLLLLLGFCQTCCLTCMAYRGHFPHEKSMSLSTGSMEVICRLYSNISEIWCTSYVSLLCNKTKISKVYSKHPKDQKNSISEIIPDSSLSSR